MLPTWSLHFFQIEERVCTLYSVLDSFASSNTLNLTSNV